MPITKNPLEFYRYYCASQRRVEQWVQDTGRLIQSSPVQSESSTTQWRGFLEDPCLATPISLPPPLDSREPQHDSGDGYLSDIPEQGYQVYPQCPTPETELQDQTHDLYRDSPCATSRRRPFATTPKGSHDDSTRPRAGSLQQISDEKPVGDSAPAVPSSSKHSKDSKHSRHTSKSKNSGSSSSKKRQTREETDIHRSIFAYVPYGIVPLLVAMTTGSSAVSLAAASLILAGFFCLDYSSTVSLSSLIFTHSSEFVSTGAKKKAPKMTKRPILRISLVLMTLFMHYIL